MKPRYLTLTAAGAIILTGIDKPLKAAPAWMTEIGTRF